MKKRILVFGLCLMLLLVCLPTASALPTHVGLSDSDYQKIVDDGGIVEIKIKYLGMDIYVLDEVDANGVLMDINDWWQNFIQGTLGDGRVFAGYESAITFKIVNDFNRSDYVGLELYMRTRQIEIPDYSPEYGIFIPKDKNSGGPLDDRGNTPTTKPSYFTPEEWSWYQQFPANALDKFQFSVYTAVVANGVASPFRDTGGAPRSPDNINSYIEMSDWITTWGSPTVPYQVNNELIPWGSTLYVHYIFYWDGGNYAPGVDKSPVAPSQSIRDMETESGGTFVEKVGSTYIITDNFYMGARGAFTWQNTDLLTNNPINEPDYGDQYTDLYVGLRRDGQGQETPSPSRPPPPPITTTTPPPPPESETPTTEGPPTEVVTDPTPPLVSPPPPPGGETPGLVETLPPGTVPRVPGGDGPDMPITGGFNLANLFFIGLFFFGIGLIYLRSRKKDEEEKTKA